jgi:hypothetical protein
MRKYVPGVPSNLAILLIKISKIIITEKEISKKVEDIRASGFNVIDAYRIGSSTVFKIKCEVEFTPEERLLRSILGEKDEKIFSTFEIKAKLGSNIIMAIKDGHIIYEIIRKQEDDWLVTKAGKTKYGEKKISVIFDPSKTTLEEILNFLLCLSNLYRAIGGDRLVIHDGQIFSPLKTYTLK